MPKIATLRPMALGALALLATGCAPRVDAPPKSLVFFANESTALDRPALSAIDQFASDARKASNRRVLVEAYSGALTSPAASQQLSLARAKAVATALIERGVDPQRIALQPRPPSGEDPGVESRRVELEFLP